jgi:hypothetical protein
MHAARRGDGHRLALASASAGWVAVYALWFALVVGVYAFKFVQTTPALRRFVPTRPAAAKAAVELLDENDGDDLGSLPAAAPGSSRRSGSPDSIRSLEKM